MIHTRIILIGNDTKLFRDIYFFNSFACTVNTHSGIIVKTISCVFSISSNIVILSEEVSRMIREIGQVVVYGIIANM